MGRKRPKKRTKKSVERSLEQAFSRIGEMLPAVDEVGIGTEGCDLAKREAVAAIHILARKLPGEPAPADVADRLEELFRDWSGATAGWYTEGQAYIAFCIKFGDRGLEDLVDWLRCSGLMGAVGVEYSEYCTDKNMGATLGDVEIVKGRLDGAHFQPGDLGLPSEIGGAPHRSWKITRKAMTGRARM
jgi:hypothetical protein